jgi:transglutaminase-like putative cysteine protease
MAVKRSRAGYSQVWATKTLAGRTWLAVDASDDSLLTSDEHADRVSGSTMCSQTSRVVLPASSLPWASTNSRMNADETPKVDSIAGCRAIVRRASTENK